MRLIKKKTKTCKSDLYIYIYIWFIKIPLNDIYKKIFNFNNSFFLTLIKKKFSQHIREAEEKKKKNGKKNI